MTSRDTIAWLYGLQASGIKLGLETMERLCVALHQPQRRFPSIHIAGTNGKGSVAAFLDSICRTAGLRAGLYTSPHLIDFSERIRVNGQPIEPHALIDLSQQLRSIVDAQPSPFSPTFFEVTTAMAFEYFANQEVDLAILETGLGGRLDSTNVVHPCCTVITSIDFDHMDYLGDTIQQIAAEKAGIIKEKVPLVLGPVQAEAREVILARAKENDAPVHEVTRAVDFAVGLKGDHQRLNAAIAATTADVLSTDNKNLTPAAIRSGIENTTWPARFQVLQETPPVVLDAGHNPAGIRAALDTWSEEFAEPPARIIFACMKDKDAASMARLIDRDGLTVWLVAPDLERATPPPELAPLFKQATTRCLRSVAEGRDELLNEPTLIIGSIFLAGEWLKLA